MSDAIEIEGLHKRYGDTVAVDDVSLTVRQGEIFGLLGRNGAGKSTTVETVAGLRRPDRGTVRVLGLDPRRDRRVLRQVLGVQLQSAQLHYALTAAELIRLHGSFYADPRGPDDLLATLGLTESRDTRFENLSGGQQQRLSIALALVGRPKVAILDELTTGLDPDARRGMWSLIEAIREAGVTVVLVSHAMEEVERLCDRVAIMDAGRIIALDSPSGLVERAGGPQQVRFTAGAPMDPALLEDLAEVEAVVVDGDEVTAVGHGELLQVVSQTLAHHGVPAIGTRSERANLEDAFLSLTGHRLEATETASTPGRSS